MTKIGADFYRHLVYGVLDITEAELEDLRAAGVAVASRRSSTDDGYHVGFDPDNLGPVEARNPGLAILLRASRGLFAEHPQRKVEHRIPVTELSLEELKAELPYARARYDWIAYAEPRDLQTKEDEDEHRFFAVYAGTNSQRPRLANIQTEIQARLKLGAAQQRDPRLSGLRFSTDPSSGGVLVRTLVDENGVTWGRSEYVDGVIAQARVNKLRSVPVHELTPDEFEESSLVVDLSTSTAPLREHFSALFELLRLSGHDVDSDKKAWVEQSVENMKKLGQMTYLDEPLAKPMSSGRIFLVPQGRQINFEATHRDMVESALREGLHVPEHVLACHPGLAESAQPAQEPTPQM